MPKLVVIVVYPESNKDRKKKSKKLQISKIETIVNDRV